MISFEQETKAFLTAAGYSYIDNSSEFKLLDFTIKDFVQEASSPKSLYLDVKEKRQKYNIENWSIIDEESEPFTFIVDELACRKMLAYAPFSGMLVRDYLSHSYYWFSILDIFLMPKRRANREIRKDQETFLKGKLLIDFRNGLVSQTLESAFIQIKQAIQQREQYYIHLNECYGKFLGEDVPIQGMVRKPSHWNIDVSETR